LAKAKIKIEKYYFNSVLLVFYYLTTYTLRTIYYYERLHRTSCQQITG